MILDKTKIPGTLRYLVISDIHLGHPNNTSEEIITNLDKFFGYYKEDIFKIDILFIAGDIFDSSLKLSNPESAVILYWLNSLLVYCDKFKIKLRVLEGTPSHDWRQSENIGSLANKITPNLDYRYFKALYIETIQDYNLTVLYVPDEWRTSTAQTLKEVDMLLAENNLEQVDIAIMHGNFKYQLTQAPDTIPKHDEASYLKRVKHFINIGHIHKFSVFERIVSQGSIDRLVQGEEEPKGGTLMSISDDKEDTFRFIENKTAKIFKTIDARKATLADIYDKLDKEVLKLRPGSYVRLRLMPGSMILTIMKEIKIRYTEYIFSTPKIDGEKDSQNDYNLIKEVMDSSDYTPIQITSDNVKTLLIDELDNMDNTEELHPHITYMIIDELLAMGA